MLFRLQGLHANRYMGNKCAELADGGAGAADGDNMMEVEGLIDRSSDEGESPHGRMVRSSDEGESPHRPPLSATAERVMSNDSLMLSSGVVSVPTKPSSPVKHSSSVVIDDVADDHVLFPDGASSQQSSSFDVLVSEDASNNSKKYSDNSEELRGGFVSSASALTFKPLVAPRLPGWDRSFAAGVGLRGPPFAPLSAVRLPGLMIRPAAEVEEDQSAMEEC